MWITNHMLIVQVALKLIILAKVFIFSWFHILLRTIIWYSHHAVVLMLLQSQWEYGRNTSRGRPYGLAWRRLVYRNLEVEDRWEDFYVEKWPNHFLAWQNDQNRCYHGWWCLRKDYGVDYTWKRLQDAALDLAGATEPWWTRRWLTDGINLKPASPLLNLLAYITPALNKPS